MIPFLVAAALGAPLVVDGEHTFRGSGDVVEIKVLAADLAKGRIAYKGIYRHTPEEMADDELVDCAYAGMEKYGPGAGVTLGLWDVAKGAPEQEWEVYPVAEDPSACLGHEASAALLAEAKARFTREGLDISKPPTLIEPKKDAVTPVAGHTLKLGTPPPEVLVIPDTEEEAAMFGRAGMDATIDGQLVYRRIVQYSLIGAGSYHIEVPWVIRDGNKLVLVEQHNASSMRGGAESFGFSPALTLP